MPDLGFRNPRRNALICAGVTLAAWISVAWGAFEMHWTGEESLRSGLMIGIGLVVGILGPAATYNFWRGMKVFATIRSGGNDVGRWTVTAGDLAEFLAGEDARNALGGGNRNLWTPPREPPPAGLQIIFGPDGVLAGDAYFPLVTTGVMPITGVRILSEGAPAIAFQVVTTAPSRFGGQASVDALRFPVPRLPGAGPARVVRHYQRVIAGAVLAEGAQGRSACTTS
jgi:hypothetical protein